MYTQFKNNEHKNYITHVILHGERIIPSDTFELGDTEYVLLEILLSTDDILFLRIMGITGPNLGNIYVIPKTDFENKTLNEIKENLKHYQH